MIGSSFYNKQSILLHVKIVVIKINLIKAIDGHFLNYLGDFINTIYLNDNQFNKILLIDGNCLSIFLHICLNKIVINYFFALSIILL